MLTDPASTSAGWQELAELGLSGLTIPEADGGAGAGFVEPRSCRGARPGPARLVPFRCCRPPCSEPRPCSTGPPTPQRAELLPGSPPAPPRWRSPTSTSPGPAADPGVRASRDGDAWVLDGTAGYVSTVLGAHPSSPPRPPTTASSCSSSRVRCRARPRARRGARPHPSDGDPHLRRTSRWPRRTGSPAARPSPRCTGR
jgi:hypothetical protein